MSRGTNESQHRDKQKGLWENEARAPSSTQHEGWLRRLEKKGAVEGERGFSETRWTRAETETTREDGTLRRARETGTCGVHRNIHIDQNLGVEVGLEHVIEDPECQAKLFLCF